MIIVDVVFVSGWDLFIDIELCGLKTCAKKTNIPL